MMDAVNAAVLARQPDYPPEQSMGGINAYNFSCKPVGYSPGYCVCLHKIAAFERDSKLAAYPECEKNIRNKDCPALRMRAEERAAGKALYFIDRQLLREEMDKHFKEITPSYRAAPKPLTTSRPAAKKAEPTPAPSSNVIADMPDEGYAAAINAAIAQTSVEQPKEEPKVTAPSPSDSKRPSLIELARMQMGKTS